MAIGQDYQCINIKAAQYNREKKQREEEARLAAQYRAEQQRRREAAARAEKARLEAKRREQVRTTAAREVRRAAVRTSVPAAASVRTAENVRTRNSSYGFGTLLAEVIGTTAVWVHNKRRERAAERAAEPEYARVHVKSHRPVPIAFFGYLAVFAVIAGMLLVGNARVSSAKSGNNELKALITAAESKGKELDEKLERGMDAAYVEAYAVGELGMVKKSEVSRKYITFGGEDKIVSGVSA